MMYYKKIIILTFGGLSWFFSFAYAQEVSTKLKDAKKPKGKSEIVVNYNDETEMGEQSFDSGESGLFDSPALASGLALGSSAINQSVETLLEQVFYSLLDRKLSYDINDDAQFAFATRRDVFPTSHGAYIVVDRFGLGPEYTKTLAEYEKVPINLGANGKVNVFNVYLRTDGMRLYEQEELPFWRMALNNWLGVLPVLTLILPPSFNPNELYDPVNLVETPFTFPVTVGGFRTMSIGSICSYNITGGISFPIDFAHAFPKDIRDALTKAENLGVSLPYSVFVEGEYRINVMRRSQDVAWVGLTTTKRLGNKISSTLGNTLEALSKVSPYWAGVPLKLLPLKIEYIRSKAVIFNHLYEFDLRNSVARDAYRKAVLGNFTFAHEQYLKEKKGKQKTGVSFQFQKTENANEYQNDVSPNLMVLTNVRADKVSKSEIEFVDTLGKFYVLEGKQDSDDIFADALTGKHQKRSSNRVEMKVHKVPDPKDKDDYIFEFIKGDKNPYQVTLSRKIIDRYIDSQEYRDAIEDLRSFTMLPLLDAPNIPRRDPEKKVIRRKNFALKDPSEDQFYLHVTPTYLGRFDATAAALFTSADFDKVLARSDSEKWQAFAIAYGLSKGYWGTRQSRESFGAKTRWFGSLVNLPLGLFNLRVAEFDFIAEATAAIDAMNDIFKAKKPMDKLAGFYRLFDTHHPEKLAKALLLLSDLNKVPRSVTFHTRAKGNAPKQVKEAFRVLDNRVTRSVSDFPQPERARISEEKLKAFAPDSIEYRQSLPSIVSVNVNAKPLPEEYIKKIYKDPAALESVGEENLNRDQVYMKLSVKNMEGNEPGKIYLKVEQAGKVTVGKFVLAERVVRMEPVKKLGKTKKENEDAPDVFEFYLTGPLSPLISMFYDNGINFGGEFELTVAVSSTAKAWSEERSFRFQYNNGTLAPPSN